MAGGEQPESEPEAAEPTGEAPAESRPGLLQWIIFAEITVLCLLAAYIQISGIKQLPLL